MCDVLMRGSGLALAWDARTRQSHQLRVEFAGERRGGRDRAPSSNYTGRHTDYRAVLKGLPRTASWQDVKDFFKAERLDVLFTDVNRDGTGVVEFGREDDLEFAIKEMDGRRFDSHLGDSETISIVDERSGSRRDDDRRDDDRRDDDRRDDRDRDDDRRDRDRDRDDDRRDRDRDDRDDDRRSDRDDRDDRDDRPRDDDRDDRRDEPAQD
eukprot:TRINITY_DN11165_c0_g1_i6.p1 TRINITY_DN11165_c0_g1~~TRINITY_DN11165_c0_g1_i6.p1  ORF type:complete len:210 (+),score=57.52 TRINITY_DN11165_c0_g1_i6:510-1139(+)